MITLALSLNSLSSFTFKISGITNPGQSTDTGFFTIRGYQFDNGNYKFIENSDTSLTVRPSPGSLTAVTLTPTDTTVGAITTLTVSLTLEHSLPVDGKIQIQFPKWNPFASSQSQMISYLSVSTSPGFGFTTSKLGCLFTVGAGTTDLLELTMNSEATSSIAAGKQLSFSISQVRTPPSLKAITNIYVYTTNSLSMTMDQSSAVTYQSTQVASIPSSYVKISAPLNSKINTLTTIQVNIKNVNPLPIGSQITITIPSEFGVDQFVSVTGTGGRNKNSPTFTISSDKRTVTVSSMNDNYFEPLVNIYLNLATLKTPLSTRPSSTFTILISDDSGSQVETVTSGVYFTPTPGTLQNAKITPTSKYINMKNLQYKFSFKPEDSFTTSAIMKITFPDQVQINNRQSQALTAFSSAMSSQARVTVTSSKYALISNPFASDYTAGTNAATIEFTLDGITNPSSLATMDSFQISIFYIDGVDIIDQITSGLKIAISGNPNIGVEILYESQETGYNNELQFKVNTGIYPIAKGSYITIFIPPEFEIYDTDIAESTCLKISGFSDEVLCQFTQNSNKIGHILQVKNGFNSKLFSGGEFAFNISQIRNPKTSQTTSNFKFQIFDTLNLLQYYYNGDNLALSPVGSPFQYAMVTSSNPINGQSSLYIFTLTFGVDTQIDSNIQVEAPNDIVYDTSRNLSCYGIVNLNQSFRCFVKNNKIFVLSIRSDQQNQSFIANGTSVSFALGYFFNPISLKESDSFNVETYATSNSNTQYFYINRENQVLTIQNTVKGTISSLIITQYGSELNKETGLRFQFKTQNKIPGGSRIVITIPSIIQVNNTKNIAAMINNQTASLTYSSDSSQVRITIPVTLKDLQAFDLNLTKGFANPIQGSYSYDTFLIDVQTSLGYSIDAIQISPALIQSSNLTFYEQNPNYTAIQINCSGNCATCQYSLNYCTGCQFDNVLMKSFYFENGQCKETCGSGQYADPSDYKCKNCEYPCQECQYGSTLCTKCYANNSAPYAYPQTLQCYSACPAGTYLDKSQNLCVKCQSPCFTCLDKDNCLTCDRTTKSNTFINYFQNKCYETCPVGTVATTQSNLCLQCISPCKNCQDGQPDQCSSCISGYYNLKNSLCVKSCPKQYLANDETMKCDYSGEMVFPLPFSILTILFAFGLLIARFMKNQTRFFITLLAFTDFVLKCNWIFLMIYLYAGKYYTSAGIITYCNAANLILNIFIWRTVYYRKQLDNDSSYLVYSEKYKYTSKFLLYFSFIFSFHVFRISYSRLLGKKQFSAQFKNFTEYVKVIVVISLINLLFICIPAIGANSYNLDFTNSTQQVYYFDIDSLLLVLFEFALVAVVIKQGEKVAMSKELLKNLIEEKADQNNKDSEQKKMEDLISQMRRQSLARKHFGGNQLEGEEEKGKYSLYNNQIGSPESNGPDRGDLNEIAEDYSKNIFKNLLKQFQSQTSHGTSDPSQKYFSQSNFGGMMDPKEYKSLKSQLKQLQILLYNLRTQHESATSNKHLLLHKLQTVNGENDHLLSEEERLKQEVEDLKRKLQEYKELNKKELEDTQNMKREQQRHKMKISKLKTFIANTVLQKGKEILKEKQVKELNNSGQNRNVGQGLGHRHQPSYEGPTISSMIKDQELEQKLKKEKTFSPHRAKPPLHQKDRSHNRRDSSQTPISSGLGGTVAKQGPKFIEDSRVSVANNFTGFRAQSEMRTQRNKSLVNTNVLVSASGSPDKKLTITQDDFVGGSADKRRARFAHEPDGWVMDESKNNNANKQNPAIEENKSNNQDINDILNENDESDIMN